MTEIVLYHNPRCSKSRAALALLEARGSGFRVVEYLREPLTRRELSELRARLSRDPVSWIRSKESAFAEAGLSESSSEEELLAAVEAHPILLERPIAVRGDRAVIGRPPERILELLDPSAAP